MPRTPDATLAHALHAALLDLPFVIESVGCAATEVPLASYPGRARPTSVVRIGEGRWDDTEARLKALAIIGQALVFRVGRATLLRAAGWTDIDAEGAAAIRRVVLTHTRAVLTDRGEAVLG